MTANWPLRRCRSASSPDRAVTTSPMSSRTVLMARRLCSSSSTTRTRGIPSIATSGLGRAGLARERWDSILFGGLRHHLGLGLGSLARAADPDPEESQQQVDVDRLGDIVRRAGI